MEQTELDLREIFQVIRRRLWLIAALPVLAALTAGLVSVFVLTPVYSASTTLLVGDKDSAKINYNELLLNRNLTKTYAEVGISRAVVADVIDRLQLKDITVPQLQAKLTVAPKRDTEILVFTVQDTDPIMAARLADAVAESFKRQVKAYLNIENVMVLDLALVPTSPIKPRPLMNTAIAFVLGMMVAIGLTFLLEYLDTSIKSPDDVTRHLGLPVLGMIPAFGENDPPASRRARNSKTKTVVEQ